MNLEKTSEPTVPRVLPDDGLRDVLEAAERRKETDLRSKSRTASIIILVPGLILAGWAAVFLICYQTDTPPVLEKPAAVAPPQPLQGADREADAAFDSFRPVDLRVNQPAQPGQKPKPAGKIIDKGDIEFAAKLLNFGNAADPPPAKH